MNRPSPTDDGRGVTYLANGYRVRFIAPGSSLIRGYWLFMRDRVTCGPYQTRDACERDNLYATGA